MKYVQKKVTRNEKDNTYTYSYTYTGPVNLVFTLLVYSFVTFILAAIFTAVFRAFGLSIGNVGCLEAIVIGIVVYILTWGLFKIGAPRKR